MKSDSNFSLGVIFWILQFPISTSPLMNMFDLILYVPSTIFQLNRDRSSWVKAVLSYDKCVLFKDHNAVMLVRLKPAAPRSRIKYSTNEPLRSHTTDEHGATYNTICGLQKGYSGNFF